MNRLEGLRPRRAAGALAGCALALALAGCFGSSSPPSSSATADPASAVPASALAYIQAVVRPTGSLLQGIDAASQRLLGIANPGPQLDALIDKSTNSGVTYEKDIRPWLGKNAAVAVLDGTTTQQAQYAIVLDTTNATKAQSEIKSHALFTSGSGTPDAITAGSYRGVSYTDDTTSKMDIGLIGSFVVITNGAAAFDAMVDVNKGAAKLGSLAAYKQAVAAELPGADGVAYLPLLKLFNLIESSSTALGATSALGSTSQALQELRTKYANAIISGSARFNANGAALDVAVSGISLGTPSGETNPIGELPAGSWLAIGGTNLGPALAKGITALGKLGSATGATSSFGNFAQSLAEIQQVTGVNIEGDLGSITTLGLFAKGTNLGSLEAGLVLGVKSPNQAPAIVSQLKRLVTLVATSDKSIKVGSLGQSNIQNGFTINVGGLPYTFDVAAGGGRIVIALGTTSLNDALASANRLSGTSEYTTTSSLLGSDVQPEVIVDIPQVLTLLKGLGALSSPSSGGVLSYLQRLGTLAIGSGRSSGAEHVRIILSPS